MDKKESHTTDLDGSLQLKKIGLFQENFFRLQTKLSDLWLRKLHLFTWSTSNLKQTVDYTIKCQRIHLSSLLQLQINFLYKTLYPPYTHPKKRGTRNQIQTWITVKLTRRIIHQGWSFWIWSKKERKVEGNKVSGLWWSSNLIIISNWKNTKQKEITKKDGIFFWIKEEHKHIWMDG